jgi:uncharacterized protein YegP (UPF0339 family)
VKRPPHFEIVKSKRNKRQPWFARIVASNGRQIWRTSENYTRKRDARRACILVHLYAADMVIR